MASTYLGSKGYSIYKECLTIQEQECIRKELMVKAFVPKSCMNQPTPFPIYRESPLKMYVPRFYGLENYGEPDENRLSEGKDINLNFKGGLRDIQKPIVKKYLKHAKINNCGLIEIYCGAGKCLGIDTPILMYDGSIKLVQDIKIGERLMGDDSTPREVLTLARGSEMMYKISSDKSDTYIVNESHILSLKCVRAYKDLYKKNEIVDISIKDYLNLPFVFNGTNDILMGYKTPILFYKKKVTTDPYNYGNNLTSSTISIENIYKHNSWGIQINVLAGIIDKFAVISKNIFEISNLSEPFLKDILFITRSLGFEGYKNKYNTIKINGEGLQNIPTKKLKLKSNVTLQNGLCMKITVEKHKIDNYYGFEIDKNRRFVLGDFTVTHNTVMSLNILAQLKKKTIIIVHKDFLLRQWKERIEQFLPDAKVGKIQGDIIDIDDKDIVIGMLQSLSMKEYPSSIFKDFGFTIIDECHHISAEVFSRSLFKIVTKYMLGLSATMDRKDGLTKVFKKFIGPVVVKKERPLQDNVTVKAIEYTNVDEKFSKVALNFRGHTNYTIMIKKLCEFDERSDFILKIVKNLIKNDTKEQHIMIIGHNKTLLKYIHDTIKSQEIAPVGYYIGGMKEKDLKESEEKKIIIATYAMAEEALDIKTLSTLIMATPKIDVRQAVGRILRNVKGKKLVIDIIDQHEIFQKHWKKRSVWYRKQQFKIMKTTNIGYDNDEWETVKSKSSSKKRKKDKVDSMLNGTCLFD